MKYVIGSTLTLMSIGVFGYMKVVSCRIIDVTDKEITIMMILKIDYVIVCRSLFEAAFSLD